MGTKREETVTAGAAATRTRRRSMTLALLVLLWPLDAAAQPRDSSRVAAVRALTLGQQVRLDVTQLGQMEGQLAFRSDTSLTLLQNAGPTHVRVADVDRLWVRGRATGTGALIGGLVGLTAGAAYGFLIGEVAVRGDRLHAGGGGDGHRPGVRGGRSGRRCRSRVRDPHLAAEIPQTSKPGIPRPGVPTASIYCLPR